ncbi:MAG: 23S rRNA (uracil(1939)-C(5))-methyltransferase RlmD [Candidatus Azobacteroides sp.]|nr:23S rRNA (uracil(1939)-C(5))-methyltransferase RlmD [Candidatus Azobacteroides sp.]
MARKKKELPVWEDITITDVAAEGKAIAKINDLVVFIPYAVPGDIVDIQIYRKKNRYAEGRVIRFKSYSDLRETPFCEHFGICGGCKWQNLPYKEQLRYKQKQVADNLLRIGKIDIPEISPILGSEKTRYYRNKLEFTFSDKRWLTENEVQSGEPVANRNALGFHIPGMFDKVLDIRECLLQDDISNQIRSAVKDFCLKNNYSFFNLREQHGLMRNLIIRTSTTGEIMLIVVFFENDREKIEALLRHISEQFPQITSLIYIVNPKANDTITDREVIVYKGKDCIYEEMEGLRFKIGPKSFYQTNSEQAYHLYKTVRDFAGLTGNELVYDLYTGTGTIANFIAHRAKKVIGIEYVPEAVEDAKENSDLNGITNTVFFAGDMKDILNQEFMNQYGRPDVIITDPPRAGMHDDVIQAILFAAPRRIVYVSCNPATQARDLNLLNEAYQVTAVQPVDMFPHTHHVENVVQLKKRLD